MGVDSRKLASPAKTSTYLYAGLTLSALCVVFLTFSVSKRLDIGAAALGKEVNEGSLSGSIGLRPSMVEVSVATSLPGASPSSVLSTFNAKLHDGTVANLGELTKEAKAVIVVNVATK